MRRGSLNSVPLVGLDHSESLFEQVWSKEILDLVEYRDDIL